MKPVHMLSDRELVGEFHAFGQLADQLKHEGYPVPAQQMSDRRWAVLTEMRRRADMN